MAHEYRQMGLRPLVLNMASDYCPGGGDKSGKVAQEECLFRRTSACETHPPEWYPLCPTDAIYSPEVFILKDAKYDPYQKYESVGLVSIAAIRRPQLGVGLEYRAEDRHLMEMKIESMFIIGLNHRYDSLVLGALVAGLSAIRRRRFPGYICECAEEIRVQFQKSRFCDTGRKTGRSTKSGGICKNDQRYILSVRQVMTMKWLFKFGLLSHQKCRYLNCV